MRRPGQTSWEITMAIPLQPQARELLEGLLKPSNVMPTLAGVRAPRPEVAKLLVGEGEPVELVWDTALQVQGSQVGLRWYQLYNDMPRVLTIFFRGGGWVMARLHPTTRCAGHALCCRTGS